METLTAPDFKGVIAVATFPLVGNYGAISEEAGNLPPVVAGYVCREACQTPSNYRMESTLAAYLEKHGVVGIEGVDTRAIRVKARSGTLYAMITPNKNNLEEKIARVRSLAAR
jgi:carbamoyl-phosphate synthase small subunit